MDVRPASLGDKEEPVADAHFRDACRCAPVFSETVDLDREIEFEQ